VTYGFHIKERGKKKMSKNRVSLLWSVVLLFLLLFAGASQAEVVKLDCGDGVEMKFALIPAGTFTMGSPSSEAGRNRSEFQREVTISKPFYMGIYLVTQAQYQALMGENPSLSKREGEDTLRYPINGLTWQEAAEFCRVLSEKTGRTVRLPTEAEWEYACRAGTTTAFSFGETISAEQANFGQQGRGMITPVDAYPANDWGLYDMHGNLMQWCSDWFERDPEDGAVTDPKGPEEGRNRVHRGGSYSSRLDRIRSAYRANSAPGFRGSHIGFRIVLEK